MIQLSEFLFLTINYIGVDCVYSRTKRYCPCWVQFYPI